MGIGGRRKDVKVYQSVLLDGGWLGERKNLAFIITTVEPLHHGDGDASRGGGQMGELIISLYKKE